MFEPFAENAAPERMERLFSETIAGGKAPTPHGGFAPLGRVYRLLTMKPNPDFTLTD
jgi:hypothetical protein